MLKNKTLLAVFIFFVYATSAHAKGYLNPLGTGIGIDKYQFLGSNGGMIVWLSEPVPQNPGNCNVTTKVHIKSSLTHFKEMAATVMAAHAQGKKVGYWSSGCGTNYFWGPNHTFPVIRDLWITN